MKKSYNKTSKFLKKERCLFVKKEKEAKKAKCNSESL